MYVKANAMEGTISFRCHKQNKDILNNLLKEEGISMSVFLNECIEKKLMLNGIQLEDSNGMYLTTEQIMVKSAINHTGEKNIDVINRLKKSIKHTKKTEGTYESLELLQKHWDYFDK